MQPRITKVIETLPSMTKDFNTNADTQTLANLPILREQQKENTPLKLRPYQEECLDAIKHHYAQGINRQLIHMATGSGKTVVFAHLISQLNRKTLVLAHTVELLEQAKEKIQMICPNLDVGIVQAGKKEFDSDIVISSIQSASREGTLENLQRQGFTLCVYDEAHRSASESGRHVLSELGFLCESNEKLLLGCTATPFRQGPKGLSAVFEKVTFSKSVKDLLASGYLCKPVGIKIKSDLDLATIQTENGDFKTEALASYMNTPQMNEMVVNAFVERAADRKTVCFSVTVSHAQNLAEAFRSRGISSEAIHGDMSPDERLNLLERFKSGQIRVLTNCQILVEGFDAPDISCVIVAKPTQSKGLFIQMAGRGLRLFPNKRDCLILDFGSKSHNLCGTAALLDDVGESQKKQKPESKITEFAQKLPPSINKKLRAAIIEFDPLGDEFVWAQDGQTFSLKGFSDKVLKIFPKADGRFNVAFFDSKTSYRTIAENLMFEYAFSIAEEFAKSNRGLFAVSDLVASWRQLPISDKQKNLFNSFGYRSGIEELTRGQAALIISSGVLRNEHKTKMPSRTH